MLNLNSLNPQQRHAVETLNGPVLILAGAGTGKTRVITYRIAHLISKGVAPGNILAVTFTNKAAREMQERIGKLIPRNKTDDKSNRPTICTFHSLCVRILRQHIEKLGYKRNFVIYDESEQLGAIKKILAQISAKGEKMDPAPVLSCLSRFKNGGEKSSVYADENVLALAQHVRARYESALHACNAVDFDDLILLTLRLFAEHPDVLELCRAKYRFVMADEYQDTNASQFQLIQALTAKHQNLCVVGDDDQSIYGWRGADIGNLLDLEKYFPTVKSSSWSRITAPQTPFFTRRTPSSKTTPAAAPSSCGRTRAREVKSFCARTRMTRTRRGTLWSRLSLRVWRTACRGATMRFSSARTRNRVRWKRRCGRPMCVTI